FGTDVRSLFRWGDLVSFLRFGSWMSVSNIVSSIIVNCDRVVVARLLSLAGAGYYAAPVEILNRLLFFPSSLVSALFPFFASRLRTDLSGVIAAFETSLAAVCAFLFPGCLVAITAAPEILRLWLGDDYA